MRERTVTPHRTSQTMLCFSPNFDGRCHGKGHQPRYAGQDVLVSVHTHIAHIHGYTFTLYTPNVSCHCTSRSLYCQLFISL